MKSLIVAFALLCSGVVSAQIKPPVHQGPNVPTNLKQYYVGFLVKTDKTNTETASPGFAAIMDKHLAYIRSQVEAGKYAVVGPIFENQRIEGMVIVNAASEQEAKQILEGDPFVKSGVGAIKVYPAMFADLSCSHPEYPRGTATK
jgi:uncharacterized protein YciI